MAEVKVLIEGYTTADSVEEEVTCSTICLIKDEDIVMITDPGVLENQQMLIDALKKENLKIEDVNVVFLTHSQIDHYRNAGMFSKAKVLEFYGIWDKNTVDDWEEQFTKNIKIIKTPGHDKTGLTLLIKTEKGTIAVVGDVFWKKDFPEEDEYADEPEKLKESRKKVLELADYIIPGHGGMFKVEWD